MKLKLLFILLLFAGVNLTLHSQSIDWAMSSNSSSVDIFYDTVVNEDNGQIFTVGLVSEEASNGFVSTENATQSEITDASDFSRRLGRCFGFYRFRRNPFVERYPFK